ncbi:MAG: hypothetical protein OEV80_07285 [candidate division Zixibacteria bacterium]|nr:hypothetical protein [candidate division Zixibacteria bacterium]
MKKHAIITTLLVLTLPPACERHIESQDPVRSLPTPLPIPINLEAVVDDATVTISWELSDSSKTNMFRVYTAESEAGEYLLSDSTTAYTVTLSGLLLNRPVFMRVTSVTDSGVESQASAHVAATPTHFSISINNDSEYASRRDVQVRINTGVNAQFVQISEQQDFGDAEWESYGVTRSFELSEDDGVKTVYVRMQFADGSETGQPLSDDITLDTFAEIETFTFFPPNDPMTEGEVTTFRMQSGEIGGEASVSFGLEPDLELFDDGTNGDAVADDATYTRMYTVPFGAYAFDEVVTGSFTDEAGNRAEDFISETLMNINTAPASVELGVSFGVDTSTVVFTWTTSSESDFESYRLINTVPGIAEPLMITTSSSTNRFEMSRPPIGSDYIIVVFDYHGDSAASNTVTAP